VFLTSFLANKRVFLILYHNLPLLCKHRVLYKDPKDGKMIFENQRVHCTSIGPSPQDLSSFLTNVDDVPRHHRQQKK